MLLLQESDVTAKWCGRSTTFQFYRNMTRMQPAGNYKSSPLLLQTSCACTLVRKRTGNSHQNNLHSTRGQRLMWFEVNCPFNFKTWMTFLNLCHLNTALLPVSHHHYQEQQHLRAQAVHGEGPVSWLSTPILHLVANFAEICSICTV